LTATFKSSLIFATRQRIAICCFSPEIQLSPFFPQYEKSDVTEYAMNTNSFEIIKLAEKAKGNSFYLSPNIYLEQDGKFSFFFTLLPDR
jgi:hypothetical protein